MEKNWIDLHSLLSSLKAGVEERFPSKLWVRAEISAIKARGGGHCYLELSQSDGDGLVAKAAAVIWSTKYRFLAPYFTSVTGTTLQEGMQVLLRVQVQYNVLYGLTLVVDDIDAEFTLGQQALQLQRTLVRLQEEGLMDLQKELALPVLPYRLAVISAPDAAGYRDFMRHLHENEFGFVLQTDLFPALMQGEGAPASIIAALDEAASDPEPYDAVLILRGGGARLDLACFDDYDLAAAIARCPVPVFTAVGHDQDFHVCDRVAYAYVKTPTALADEFLSYYQAEDERISSYSTRLRTAFLGKIADLSGRLDRLESGIRTAVLGKIAGLSGRLDLLESRIRGADPRRLLRRGYVLVTDTRGTLLKSAAGISPGDSLTLVFADGTLEAQVTGLSEGEPFGETAG